MTSYLYRSRIARVVVLVLGILSLPGTGLQAVVPRPHCATHEHSSPGDHKAAAAHKVVLQSGTGDECPHCPATQCAHQVPCAASSNLLIHAPSAAGNEPSSYRLSMPAVLATFHSRSHQPPTPPPQL